MHWGWISPMLIGNNWTKFDSGTCGRPPKAFPKWQRVTLPVSCCSVFISSMLAFATPSAYSKRWGLLFGLFLEKNIVSRNSLTTITFQGYSKQGHSGSQGHGRCQELPGWESLWLVAVAMATTYAGPNRNGVCCVPMWRISSSRSLNRFCRWVHVTLAQGVDTGKL